MADLGLIDVRAEFRGIKSSWLTRDDVGLNFAQSCGG